MTGLGEYLAGGIDVNDRRRLGISAGPLVDIAGRAELAGVSWRADGGADLGALATVAELAGDARLAAAYPALTAAAGGLATPQVRNVATLGGNLAQRPQCWYYRNPAFSCFQSGGSGCPARSGDHRYLAAFQSGPCIAVHPSTLAAALLAYHAEVTTDRRERVPMAVFLGDGSDPTRTTTLDPGELIARVALPPPVAGERGAYFRTISRAEAEWPLAEAAARVAVEGGRFTLGRVAVGGVAPVPLALPQVEAALQGAAATAATIESAAALAVVGADPLPMTAYKLPLLVGTVQEALERALGE